MRPKQQKISLSVSRDIPFNRLLLSQSNVRHVKAGVSIEELAEGEARPEIAPVERFQCRAPFAMRMAGARRTLLSSITVRPVLDESGA